MFRHPDQILTGPRAASFLLAASLLLALSPGKSAWAQEDDEDATEEEQIVPDYLNEDLFIDVEEGSDEPETDFFDNLEISPDGLEDSETESLEGVEVGGLNALPSMPERLDRDYASYWDTAVFRALDKVTARIRIVEAPLNEAVQFERFEILVRQCNKRPPEETPNTTAFVEILEIDMDEQSETVVSDGINAQSKLVMAIGLEEEANGTKPANSVFSGWMFASSPGLSAVEHPVYDVWLIDCKRVAPDIVETSDENEIFIEPAE